MTVAAPHEIPLWLKLSYTLFVGVLVPVYWKQYGPGNFLWFSDIALFITVPALWLESSLLASMMLLATLVFDVAWNTDFFVRLLSGRSLIKLTTYMFDHRVPLPVRALSFFHVALPMLLIWLVFALGYDGRALIVQTMLAWILLALSYLLTRRSENVNWVHGFGDKPQTRMPPLLHLALLMILFPVVIYLPTHWLLKTIFG